MLTSIDVKFIFDSACLSTSLRDKGLFSSANILLIAAVVHRDVFLLLLLYFLANNWFIKTPTKYREFFRLYLYKQSIFSLFLILSRRVQLPYLESMQV